MRKHFIAWIVAGIIVGGLLSFVAAQHSGHTVELKNAQGESVGTATLSTAGQRCQSEAGPEKPSAGLSMRFTFHQMAKCEGPTFETAGEHFNPDSKMHGTKKSARSSRRRHE